MKRFMRFLAQRIVLIPVSLFVVITLSFGIIELLPGDPALAILGEFATEESLQQVREELELDETIWVRYAHYLGRVVQGDLGESFFSGREITSEIARFLPNTIELVVVGLIVASVIGTLVGTLGAYFRGGAPDRFARLMITVFQSTPPFLLALLLIYFMFYLWGWAPAPVGRLPLTVTGVGGAGGGGWLLFGSLFSGNWSRFVTVLHHMLMPAITLGFVYAAYVGKTTRATMAQALASAQVEFARASGLPERKIIRYAFLQARTPILTYGLILFGALVGGAAIVEIVFSWRGVGEWALRAMLDVDAPAIQGFIIITGIITLTVYLVLDLIVLFLDPRVTYD